MNAFSQLVYFFFHFLDNVETFIAQLTTPRPVGKSSTSQKKAKNEGVKSERNFTEEQMPIQTQKKPRKNILTFMTNQTKGPLSALKDCIEKEKKVKVYTRKLNGIRGYLTGVLVAFDKHWNLALMDVDETYSRPRYPKPEYDNGTEGKLYFSVQ